MSRNVTGLRDFLPRVRRAPTIADVCQSRENNFDFIRFMAAGAVILSHAYPLSLGSDRLEPLAVISRGQLTMGSVAVAVFFVISGFLITQSYDRSRSLSRFTRARALRILPGLFGVTLVTAFVIGPMVTQLSPSAYFADARTYGYLLSAVPLSINRALPGVFHTNVFPDVVNGSLWTLEAEVICYVGVGLVGFLRGIRPHLVLLLFVVLFLVPYIHLPDRVGLPWRWESDLELARYFGAGMCLYAFRRHIPLSASAAALSLGAIALLALSARGFIPGLIIFGSYLVIWLGFNKRVRLSSFSRRGDLSYGIYIYAFPIQQTVVQFAGAAMNPLVNFLISFLLVIPCAFASWHLVEKRFLRLKDSAHVSTTQRVVAARA